MENITLDPEYENLADLTYDQYECLYDSNKPFIMVIIVFYYISDSDAISAVYTLASYTYGPILGLFAFGLAVPLRVRDRFVPVVCIAAPVICYFVQRALLVHFGYTMSFELLLLNAAVTFVGLLLLSKGRVADGKELDK